MSIFSIHRVPPTTPQYRTHLPAFKTYRDLVHKVRTHCTGIRQRYRHHMQCRRSCSGCCRHISIFPVEAAFLAAALHDLNIPRTAAWLAPRQRSPEKSDCPLLWQDACRLYGFRPIICRTHGFPLLIENDGRRQIDCCPKNFQNLDSLPAGDTLNLETLNQLLATVNRVFLAERNQQPTSPRLLIAEVLTAYRNSPCDISIT